MDSSNFHYYWTEYADPRTLDFPLINSIYKMPLILLAYLYFVFVCGPRFMKNRPPYSLKTFIKLYNIVQFVVNLWIVYEFLTEGLLTRKLFCPIEVDYTINPTTKTSLRCAWAYLLLKFLDLVETGIFVLRKKNNQVSGLHVYHHVSTAAISWISFRYICITPVVFISVINSFVHAVMYIYYFLATYGPNVQKTIAPMKHWLTIMQMVQFVVIILYVSQNFFCKVMTHWVVLMFIQDILLNFYMFYKFYKETYTKLKKKI